MIKTLVRNVAITAFITIPVEGAEDDDDAIDIAIEEVSGPRVYVDDAWVEESPSEWRCEEPPAPSVEGGEVNIPRGAFCVPDGVFDINWDGR